MDKFVIRKTLWKVKDYDTEKVKAQTTVAAFNKSTKTKKSVELSDKLINKDSNEKNVLSAKNNGNANTKTNQASLTRSDSGISNTSSNEPSEFCQENIENIPPNTSDCIKSKINDYVNEQASEQEKVSFQTLVVSKAPSVNTQEFDKMLHRDLKPKASQNSPSKKTAHSTPKTSHNQLARINQDINSPSASVRLRAIKALNCPVSNNYQLFDVSHNEENIITEEERNPPAPPSLAELMKTIKVYVEVRSGEDNRSMGIKQVIAAMGAHVNDKLLRDTTHVVFKDGLLSTYRKAKHWNIPIVSILWIEACRLQQRICLPKDFPISNMDRYENPEYYEKMKRVKSMQPDSECNIRVRVKPSTPKDANLKSQLPTTLPKRLTTGGSVNRTSSAPNSPKTGQNSEDNNNIKTVSRIRPKINHLNNRLADTDNIDSPATRFLKKVESNNMTPLANTKIKQTQVHVQANADAQATKVVENEVQLISSNNEKNTGQTSQLNLTRRTLYTFASEEIPETSNKISDSRIHLRRRSTMNVTRMSCIDMSLDKTLKKCDEDIAAKEQPVKKDMSCMTNNTLLQRRQSARRKTINSNKKKSPEKEKKNPSPKKKRGQRRLTTFEIKPIEIEENSKDLTDLQRTTYTPRNMEESCDLGRTITADDLRIDDLCESLSITRIPEQPLASSTMQVLTEESKAMPSTGIVFDSTRQPGRRRSLFDVSMDIISERLQNINRSARRSTIIHSALPTIVDEAQETQALAKECEESESSDAKQYTEARTLTPSQTLTPASSESLIKKKRKLFAPNNNDSSLLFGTPPPIPKTLTNDNVVANNISSPSPLVQKKRRRTLMPLSQPCTTSNSKTRVAGGSDDDAVNCIPATAPVSKTIESESEKRSLRRSTMDFDLSVKKSEKMIKASKPKPFKYLVATNMHKVQKDVVVKALKKLGTFSLENIVSDKTTHVVTLEPRRTINLLRGLARGLWILEYAWITDSLLRGYWHEEEPYELKDFSNAIKICRAERQAFGNDYSCELFTTLGAFYISATCGKFNKNMMVEFIKLGGGHMVDERSRAKYIICNVQHCLEDKIHITPKWVLDSITQMQLQDHGKYAPTYKGPPIGKPLSPRSNYEQIPNRYLLQHQHP